MPIRLFTAGKHKSVHGTFEFSNDDIDRILAGTQKGDREKIPFVLGHPKNNLPIVGWLPKTAIQKYTEDDKISLGFERDQADLSNESMDVIRKLKSNRISVRLENGAIRHIGLVEKAAVEENNFQDFAYSDFQGVIDTGESIVEKEQSDFSKAFKEFTNDFKSIFKPINMAEEKKDAQVPNADMAALIEQNRKLAEQVATLGNVVNGFVGKAKATADFSADDYKNLSATQKDTAAGIMADLGTDESKTALKGLLKELAKPAVKVENGSKVNDFGAPADDDKLKTVADLVREQMEGA